MNDIMGGMFGAIGVLAALRERVSAWCVCDVFTLADGQLSSAR